jgi:hypothetical protein
MSRRRRESDGSPGGARGRGGPESGARGRGEPQSGETGRGRRAPGAPGAARKQAGAPGRRPARLPFPLQVGVLVAVFALVTVIAELAGAANLGVSLGIASIVFAIALMAMMLEG